MGGAECFLEYDPVTGNAKPGTDCQKTGAVHGQGVGPGPAVWSGAPPTALTCGLGTDRQAVTCLCLSRLLPGCMHAPAHTLSSRHPANEPLPRARALPPPPPRAGAVTEKRCDPATQAWCTEGVVSHRRFDDGPAIVYYTGAAGTPAARSRAATCGGALGRRGGSAFLRGDAGAPPPHPGPPPPAADASVHNRWRHLYFSMTEDIR